MENSDSHFNQNTYTFSLVLTTCLCPNHMVSSFQVDLLVISIFFSVKENRIKNEKKKKDHKRENSFLSDGDNI